MRTQQTFKIWVSLQELIINDEQGFYTMLEDKCMPHGVLEDYAYSIVEHTSDSVCFEIDGIADDLTD